MRKQSQATVVKSSGPAAVNKKGSSGGRMAPCWSKSGMKRGPWTPEEDELLSSYIKREGEGQWRILPKRAGLLRCGKSCRLRWMNYLRPSVKRGHIAEDEEDLILRLHRLLGNRWSLIAGRIPGRTDNEIKNYWNTHLSKKLIRQGIDPKTHKPFPESSPSSLSKPNIEDAAPLPRPPPRGKKRNINSLPSSSKRLSILCGEKSSSPSTNTSVLPPPPHEKPVLPDTYNEILISTIKRNEIDFKGKSELTSNEVDDCHEEDENTKRYRGDDAFSSFMNSLMDEVPDSIIPSSDFSNDFLISNPSQTFTLFGGVGWDAPIMNSPDQLAWRNLHDSKNFNEDVGKHF